MTENPARGRYASRPRDIPWRGWKELLLRTWKQSSKDHVGLIAAGVAFYSLLALFPAITALMAIAGLMFQPDQVTEQLSMVTTVLPSDAATIIRDQASSVAGTFDGGLGFAAVFGLALALWSSSRGVGSLIEGVNIAYDEAETRSIVRLALIRLALTLFLIAGVIIGLAATIVIPSLLSLVALGQTAELVISVSRWVVLLVIAVLGLAVVYRYAPDRTRAKWRWLTPGAALATVLWLAASFGFALYVQHFASYQETFGTLAGVIILLMWLWLSSYVLLLGAELDAEAEAQTRIDTTVDPAMPMGARGATKADTVAD